MFESARGSFYELCVDLGRPGRYDLSDARAPDNSTTTNNRSAWRSCRLRLGGFFMVARLPRGSLCVRHACAGTAGTGRGEHRNGAACFHSTVPVAGRIASWRWAVSIEAGDGILRPDTPRLLVEGAGGFEHNAHLAHNDEPARCQSGVAGILFDGAVVAWCCPAPNPQAETRDILGFRSFDPFVNAVMSRGRTPSS